MIEAEGDCRWDLQCMSSLSLISVLCLLSASDYIIKEKTVLLQKKDSEGFGFVLRGAKGNTCEINKHPALQ